MIDPNLLNRQREHFENVASDYSAIRLVDANYSRFKKLLWRYALKGLQLPKRNSLSVLEAMCGLCDGLKILCENNVSIGSYEAFDFSDAMVNKAREIAPSIAATYEVEVDSQNISCADICTYMPSKRHDVVILIGGLHHVYAHTKVALDRISASLDKGGLFINFEPTHSNPLAQFIRERIYSANDFFDNQTESGYRLSTYNQYLEQSGFRIVRQIYPGLLLYCLFYNPDAFTSFPPLPSWMMNWFFRLEKLVYRTPFARYFSFATITIAEATGLG